MRTVKLQTLRKYLSKTQIQFLYKQKLVPLRKTMHLTGNLPVEVKVEQENKKRSTMVKLQSLEMDPEADDKTVSMS